MHRWVSAFHKRLLSSGMDDIFRLTSSVLILLLHSHGVYAFLFAVQHISLGTYILCGTLQLRSI